MNVVEFIGPFLLSRQSLAGFIWIFLFLSTGVGQAQTLYLDGAWLVRHPQVLEIFSDIQTSLFKANGDPKTPVKFYPSVDEKFGGYIYSRPDSEGIHRSFLTAGLIQSAENSYQVAAVAAHELAHYLAGHYLENSIFGTIYREYEADELGLKIYLKAGFPPEEYKKAFERMNEMYSAMEELRWRLDRSHPLTHSRVKTISDLLEYYLSLPEFQNIPRKELANITLIDKSAYSPFSDLQTHLKNNEYDVFLEKLEKRIELLKKSYSGNPPVLANAFSGLLQEIKQSKLIEMQRHAQKLLQIMIVETHQEFRLKPNHLEKDKKMLPLLFSKEVAIEWYTFLHHLTEKHVEVIGKEQWNKLKLHTDILSRVSKSATPEQHDETLAFLIAKNITLSEIPAYARTELMMHLIRSQKWKTIENQALLKRTISFLVQGKGSLLIFISEQNSDMFFSWLKTLATNEISQMQPAERMAFLGFIIYGLTRESMDLFGFVHPVVIKALPFVETLYLNLSVPVLGLMKSFDLILTIQTEETLLEKERWLSEKSPSFSEMLDYLKKSQAGKSSFYLGIRYLSKNSSALDTSSLQQLFSLIELNTRDLLMTEYKIDSLKSSERLLPILFENTQVIVDETIKQHKKRILENLREYQRESKTGSPTPKWSTYLSSLEYLLGLNSPQGKKDVVVDPETNLKRVRRAIDGKQFKTIDEMSRTLRSAPLLTSGKDQVSAIILWLNLISAHLTLIKSESDQVSFQKIAFGPFNFLDRRLLLYRGSLLDKALSRVHSEILETRSSWEATNATQRHEDILMKLINLPQRLTSSFTDAYFDQYVAQEIINDGNPSRLLNWIDKTEKPSTGVSNTKSYYPPLVESESLKVKWLFEVCVDLSMKNRAGEIKNLIEKIFPNKSSYRDDLMNRILSENVLKNESIKGELIRLHSNDVGGRATAASYFISQVAEVLPTQLRMGFIKWLFEFGSEIETSQQLTLFLENCLEEIQANQGTRWDFRRMSLALIKAQFSHLHPREQAYLMIPFFISKYGVLGEEETTKELRMLIYDEINKKNHDAAQEFVNLFDVSHNFIKAKMASFLIAHLTKQENAKHIIDEFKTYTQSIAQKNVGSREKMNSKFENVFGMNVIIAITVEWLGEKLMRGYDALRAFAEEMIKVAMDSLNSRSSTGAIVGATHENKDIEKSGSQTDRSQKSEENDEENRFRNLSSEAERERRETESFRAMLSAMNESDRKAIESEMAKLETGKGQKLRASERFVLGARKVMRDRGEAWRRGTALAQMANRNAYEEFRKEFHGMLREWLKESQIKVRYGYTSEQEIVLVKVKDYGATATLVQQFDFILASYGIEVCRLMREGYSFSEASRIALEHIFSTPHMVSLIGFIAGSAGTSFANRVTLGEVFLREDAVVKRASQKVLGLYSSRMLGLWMKATGFVGLMAGMGLQKIIWGHYDYHDWWLNEAPSRWPSNKKYVAMDKAVRGTSNWIVGMVPAGYDIDPELLAKARESLENTGSTAKSLAELEVVRQSEGYSFRFPMDIPLLKHYPGPAFGNDWETDITYKMRLEMGEPTENMRLYAQEHRTRDLILEGIIVTVSGAVAHTLVPFPVLGTAVMMVMAGMLEEVKFQVVDRWRSDEDIDDWEVEWDERYARLKSATTSLVAYTQGFKGKSLTAGMVQQYLEKPIEQVEFYHYLLDREQQRLMMVIQGSMRHIVQNLVEMIKTEQRTAQQYNITPADPKLNETVRRVHRALMLSLVPRPSCQKPNLQGVSAKVEKWVMDLRCAVQAMDRMRQWPSTRWMKQDQSHLSVQYALETLLDEDYRTYLTHWEAHMEDRLVTEGLEEQQDWAAHTKLLESVHYRNHYEALQDAMAEDEKTRLPLQLVLRDWYAKEYMTLQSLAQDPGRILVEVMLGQSSNHFDEALRALSTSKMKGYKILEHMGKELKRSQQHIVVE